MRRIRRVGKLEMFKIKDWIVGNVKAQSGYVTPFATRLNGHTSTDLSPHAPEWFQNI